VGKKYKYISVNMKASPEDLARMEVGRFVSRGSLIVTKTHAIRHRAPLCNCRMTPGQGYRQVCPRLALSKVECKVCRKIVEFMVLRLQGVYRVEDLS